MGKSKRKKGKKAPDTWSKDSTEEQKLISMAEKISGKTAEGDTKKKKEGVTEAEMAVMDLKATIQEGLIPSSSASSKLDALALQRILASVCLCLDKMTVAEEKENLILFLASAAASPVIAASFEKSLPTSATDNLLWTGDYNTILAAGTLGCLILSHEKRILPVALHPVKALWVKNNGGFYNCFTAKAVSRKRVGETLDEAIKLSATCFDTSAMEVIKKCISRNIPTLEFRTESLAYTILVQVFRMVIDKTQVWVPASVKSWADEAADFAKTVFNWALSLGFVMVLISSLVKKKKEEGFLIIFLNTFISIIDRLLIFLFGTRGTYISFAIIGFITLYVLKVKGARYDARLIELSGELRMRAERMIETLGSDGSPEAGALAKMLEGSVAEVPEEISALEIEEEAPAKPAKPKSDRKSARTLVASASAIQRRKSYKRPESPATFASFS
jgi:hypothetical protein